MAFAPTKISNVLGPAAPNDGTASRSAVKSRAVNCDLTWTSMAYVESHLSLNLAKRGNFSKAMPSTDSSFDRAKSSSWAGLLSQS